MNTVNKLKANIIEIDGVFVPADQYEAFIFSCLSKSILQVMPEDKINEYTEADLLLQAAKACYGT